LLRHCWNADDADNTD